ncbi:hypothetical protein QCA50_013847 [Cerrena zonata]|uniref:Uncharacterized protein n=1 Tax=Cerrena zonata TaxID=2478898 RepID=A0AAW0FUG2_9APHY
MGGIPRNPPPSSSIDIQLLLQEIEDSLDKLNRKLESHEANINAKIDAFVAKFEKGFDALNEGVSRIEASVTSIETKLISIDTGLTSINTTLAAISTEATSISANVKAIGVRLSNINRLETTSPTVVYTTIIQDTGSFNSDDTAPTAADDESAPKTSSAADIGSGSCFMIIGRVM